MNNFPKNIEEGSSHVAAGESGSGMFSKLFPELTGKALAEAEANFDDYLGFVVRLYERIREDPDTIAQLRADLAMIHAESHPEIPHSLTGGSGRPTIQAKVDSPIDN